MFSKFYKSKIVYIMLVILKFRSIINNLVIGYIYDLYVDGIVVFSIQKSFFIMK